jgi:hypothetical protein
MASSGSFSGSIKDGHYVLRVDWTQTQDVTNNQSTITAKIYLVNDYSLQISARTANYITIDGTKQSYSSAAISTTGTHLLNTVTQTVSHNSDGSKSLDLYCYFSIAATLSGTYYSSITASASITLDSIPRASSVSMATGTMGSASTITITRASSAFTHTLSYTFGSYSATIVTQTSDTSVSWTPPLILANQVPKATSGTGTLTCTTYNGSTTIGSKSITITLKVPTSVVPTIASLTATRVDGDVPSTWGIYVQTKSKATLAISGASGIYGSTITSYSITGGGFSGTSSSLTTGYLNTSGTITFTATVTDSRGRTSAAATVSISVVAYSPPSFTSYSSQRCTSSGTISDSGTYVKGTVKYSYSSCSSKNSVTRATYYRKSGTTTWTNASKSFSSGTAFTFGGGNISTESTYEIKYQLTDSFTTVSVTDTVSTAAVVMDFLSGGKGVAIGKVAETKNCFEVSSDWSAKFLGTTYLGTSTLGGTAKPIYLKSGVPTACSSTIGGTARPVYLSSGTVTACTGTVGGDATPVYMSSGTIKACTPSSIVGGVCADYVTEQGTSGIWTYRKWNSGIAECWGVYKATGVSLVASHYSGFYYSASISVALPFTFASAPEANYSGGTTNYITFVTPCGQATTTAARFWVACLDSGASSCSIVVNISVKGKWQ